MSDFHKAGGVSALLKTLIDANVGIKNKNTISNPQPKTIAAARFLINFFFSTRVFTNGLSEHARTYDAKNIIAISEFLKIKIMNNIESIRNTIFFAEI